MSDQEQPNEQPTEEPTGAEAENAATESTENAPVQEQAEPVEAAEATEAPNEQPEAAAESQQLAQEPPSEPADNGEQQAAPETQEQSEAVAEAEPAALDGPQEQLDNQAANEEEQAVNEEEQAAAEEHQEDQGHQEGDGGHQGDEEAVPHDHDQPSAGDETELNEQAADELAVQQAEQVEIVDDQAAADEEQFDLLVNPIHPDVPRSHRDPEQAAEGMYAAQNTIATDNGQPSARRPSAKSVKIVDDPEQLSERDLMQPSHIGADQITSVASRQAVNIALDAGPRKKQASSVQSQDQVFQDLVKDASERATRNSLNLVWSFGFSPVVPVLNLSTPKRKQVLYTSSHIGIIFDFRYNKQRILEGHHNVLTCTCASFDKRWIATGDCGKDSAVIVWDSNSCAPVRTIFEPHPNGVVAIALTPDAKYLATLSASVPQTFAIWDWTTGSEEPICSCVLGESYGLQNYILFDPADVSNVITNSEKQVIFYNWKGGNIHYFAPPLTDRDFNKPVGKFAQTIFYQETQALTVTSLGNLVVWALDELSKTEMNSTANKKPLKILKIQDRAMTSITTSAEYIVTADVLGHVKFFDQSLRLLFWLQDFHVGSINSLSFSYAPNETLKKMDTITEYPTDTTIPAAPFPFADFVIGSTSAICAHLTAATRKLELIRKEHNTAVNAIAVHGEDPLLAIGGVTGLLQLWNYETKTIVASRLFEQNVEISCLMYDQECAYLVVGFGNSTLRILDANTLQDELAEPFTYAKAPITHITFTHDNLYLATADAAHTITLYKRQNPGELWQYMCRYHTHCKPVRDLLAGVHIDTNKPRLLSIGEDRMLVEYDLENSGVDDLRILARQRFEQSAMPLCMTWYPPVYKEQFLCTANNQLKFKLYNAVTKMCRKTVLGPCYGSCVQKMTVLNTQGDHSIPRDKYYLGYITQDKVGLHVLPADGNPYRSTAMLCHPRGVANMVCSHDGKYIFTAGGLDSNVHMYKVCVDMLEAQLKLGGEGLTPFYDLVEDGRDGTFFSELENYFYYAQLRSQGINTMETRRVSKTIPLSEVPFVMRAIGFYPTEQEIEDIINEVKFSRYVETGQTVDEIDLGDFLKLYINHRPVYGLQLSRLREAFSLLGFPDGDQLDSASEGGSARGHFVHRDTFLDILQKRGEHMSEAELAEYLVTLLGFNAEGGRSELQIVDPADAEETLNTYLPEEINADVFAQQILGLSGASTSEQTQGSIEKRDAEVAAGP